MRYSIIFTGSNTEILKYLACQKDINISYAFFHKKSKDSSHFIALCQKYDIPFKIVSGNKDIFHECKKIAKVDLGISANFEILSERVFGWPRKGFINVHPSYLPYYKGSHPFFYMLINNEKKGGVSIHRVTKKIDSGRILCRVHYPILSKDDIGALEKRATRVAIKLLEKNLVKILQGEIKGTSNKKGNYFPPVKTRQYINLEMKLFDIYNLVRSQTTYGGCFLRFKGEVVRVIKASLGKCRDECKPRITKVRNGIYKYRFFRNNRQITLTIESQKDLKDCVRQ